MAKRPHEADSEVLPACACVARIRKEISEFNGLREVGVQGGVGPKGWASWMGCQSQPWLVTEANGGRGQP